VARAAGGNDVDRILKLIALERDTACAADRRLAHLKPALASRIAETVAGEVAQTSNAFRWLVSQSPNGSMAAAQFA
jgi:hypothetical protein